jgi:hypothetical protein
LRGLEIAVRPRTLLRLSAVCFVVLGLLFAGTPANATIARVRALLPKLAVRHERNAGYDRAKFGDWIDANGDGCDTRAEVLISESLKRVTKTSSCTVLTGKWLSPFDQKTWKKASDVDIDHQVPLAEAWGSGARRWSSARRVAYANDLKYAHSLNAMTDNLNESKGDRDPAGWLPPKLRCKYVTWFMQVKYRWRLSIDRSERRAIHRIVSVRACGRIKVKLAPRAPKTPSGGGGGGGGGGGRCTNGYSPCLVYHGGKDYDCYGQGGNGPYLTKPGVVYTVTGSDPYRLDGNNNGRGCE